MSIGRYDCNLGKVATVPFSWFYMTRNHSTCRALARLAPTGIEGPPEPKRIGTETFYFYGPGGGGVAYADSYFFDLRGKTLDFTFQAAPDNNIPSPYTQSVEEPMLQTFRTFSPK